MKIITCIGLILITSNCLAQENSKAETNEVLPKPESLKMQSEPSAIPQPPVYIYETHKAPKGREEEVRIAEEKAYKRPTPAIPPVSNIPAEAGLPNDL